jgi:hypothetical protein
VAKKKTRTKQGSSFLAVVGRAVSATWSALAKALGSSVRFLARGAKDLDPAHRRDGAGLIVLILAIASLVGTWFKSESILSAIFSTRFSMALLERLVSSPPSFLVILPFASLGNQKITNP